MRKILLIFMIISSFAFGQNNYITQKDFVPNGNNLLKVDKMIKTTNGENETVNTKLFIGKEKSDKHDAKFFNKMIDILLIEAKFTLKNKSSFKPIDISIYQDKNEKWFTRIGYSGTNSYGGKKDAEYSLIFDNDLKYEKRYQSPEL